MNKWPGNGKYIYRYRSFCTLKLLKHFLVQFGTYHHLTAQGGLHVGKGFVNLTHLSKEEFCFMMIHTHIKIQLIRTSQIRLTVITLLGYHLGQTCVNQLIKSNTISLVV